MKKKLKPLRPDFTSVDLPDLFCGELEQHLEPSQFTIELGEKPVIGNVDTRLFAEVIDELVLNSRKAKEGGTSTLVVSVRFSTFKRLGGPWCRIEYHDNGPGIPPSKMEEVLRSSTLPGRIRTRERMAWGYHIFDPYLKCIMVRRFASPCDQGACFVLELPSDVRFKYPTEIDAKSRGANT